MRIKDTLVGNPIDYFLVMIICFFCISAIMLFISL